MDIVSGLVVYILLWWWVFFMVLPFGNRPADAPEPGHATSAPAKPRLRLKMAITTLIAALLFVLVWWIITSGFISFREMAG